MHRPKCDCLNGLKTCVLMSTKYYAFHMASTWLPHGFHMASTCIPHVFHMASTCLPYGFKMASACLQHAFQHAFHMAFMWLPHTFTTGFLLDHALTSQCLVSPRPSPAAPRSGATSGPSPALLRLTGVATVPGRHAKINPFHVNTTHEGILAGPCYQ